MRRILTVTVAAIFLVAAVPVRAESAKPVALVEEPTYFGLSKETALTIAALGAATVAGGAVVVYSVAGTAGLVTAAATLYASHFVVEAALLAGASSAWLSMVGITPAEN